MAEVVSRRITPDTSYPASYSWKTPGTPIQRNLDFWAGLGLTTPVQQTTSFRTGRTVRESEVDLLPETQIEAQRYYRDQWKREHRSGSDTGHTFSTFRQEVDFPYLNLKSNGYEYSGPCISNPIFHSPAGATYPATADLDLDWYGTKAIAATIPTNPVANLAVALAELKRDGLPRLPGFALLKSKVPDLRSMGKEHLNAEFGIKPLFADVQDTMRAVKKASDLLQQYHRDSGRNIRRRYAWPADSSVVNLPPRYGEIKSSVNSTAWRDQLFYQSRLDGELRESTSVSNTMWFSGAYTYYLPGDNNAFSEITRIARDYEHLWGLKLTPEVVWELAPWSWFGDWIWNIQDNIHNAQMLSQDGLVIRWGYVMCTQVRERTLTLNGIRRFDGTTIPPLTTVYRTIHKQRVKATPFGFGRSPAGFTNRQWAILAALGMTKSPKSL